MINHSQGIHKTVSQCPWGNEPKYNFRPEYSTLIRKINLMLFENMRLLTAGETELGAAEAEEIWGSTPTH